MDCDGINGEDFHSGVWKFEILGGHHEVKEWLRIGNPNGNLRKFIQVTIVRKWK